MFDPSAEKFAALGENRIAYIKAIRSDKNHWRRSSRPSRALFISALAAAGGAMSR